MRNGHWGQSGLAYVLPMVLLGGLVISGCGAPKANLTQMQTQFEDLGQMVGRAQVCHALADTPAVMEDTRTRLENYAGKNGANSEQQASLLSYFDAAVLVSKRDRTPCNAEEQAELVQEVVEQSKIYQ